MALTEDEAAFLLTSLRTGASISFGIYGRGGGYTASHRGGGYQIDHQPADEPDCTSDFIDEAQMRAMMDRYERDFRAFLNR